MTALPPLEISTSDSPDASVIWLHGLGADGYDFAPVVEALQPLPHIRFILPHAPAMPVTFNGGYVMPAWYDIYDRDIVDRQDEAGIRATQARIDALITYEQQRSVDPARIVLAGFSQGGAIALHTGLRHPHRLAGIMALSTYLPLQPQLAQERSPENATLPIFMAHGQFDDIIAIARAQASRELLEGMGYPLEWHEYTMPHSVCNEEVADIRDFLLRVLPPR